MRFCWTVLCLLMLTSPVCAAPQTAQDVFVGTGTSGPFMLSWRGIVPATEIVSVNGVAQARGLDYALDPSAGTLTFAHPLPANAATQIHYVYDPAVAVRTRSGLSVPLAFDLARTDRFQLSLDALARQDGPLTVGVGAGWRGGSGTSLTTRISFAPALNATDAAAVPNGPDRLGLSVAGGTDAGRATKLAFGYARAGIGAGSAAGDIGAAAGGTRLTMGGQFAPSHQFQATLGYARMGKFDGSDVSAQTTAAVTVAPDAKLRVQTNLARSVARDGQTDTASVNVNAKPAESIQFDAAYNVKNVPGAASDTQNVTLTTALTPTKTFALAASAGQTTLGETTVAAQTASLTLTPRPTLQLSTSVALRQSEAADFAITAVGATMRPFGFLEIAGGYKMRVASGDGLRPNDLLDTGTARLALAPLKTFRVVGTFAQNPDDGGMPTALVRQGVGVETSVGALSLSGGYDWSQATHAPASATTVRADIGLRFSPSTALTGGYQQTLTGVGLTPVGTSAFSLGFRRVLGDRFNFALSGTLQKPVGSPVSVPVDYNATANLGVKF